MKHHPDKGGSTALFQLVSAAYRVLSSPELREAYLRGEDDGAAIDEDVGSLTDQVRSHPRRPLGLIEFFFRVECVEFRLRLTADRLSHRFALQVERRYFPERTGFRAFGDPHQRKRTFMRAEAERRRQAALREDPASRDEL